MYGAHPLFYRHFSSDKPAQANFFLPRDGRNKKNIFGRRIDDSAPNSPPALSKFATEKRGCFAAEGVWAVKFGSFGFKYLNYSRY